MARFLRQGAGETDSSTPLRSAQNDKKVKTPEKKKLSYKEQQELKALEERLPALEAEKADLEAQLSGGELALEELQAASARYGALQEELDTAEMRWL